MARVTATSCQMRADCGRIGILFVVMKKFLTAVLLVVAFVLLATSDVPDQTAEFLFARLQFNMTWNVLGQSEAPWHHDYPYSEEFFLGMVRELTGIHTSREAYQIVQLEEEDIFSYPFVYVSEPGFMDLTAKEADNLREYFDRGGFIMFDDFRGRDLAHLGTQLKKVYPSREMIRLEVEHPIFRSLYTLDTLEMTPPYYDERFGGRGPEFWGMEDDRGRLIFIANHNNDFGELWEWVDRGDLPFEPAAKSVRMGINYLMYSMTH